MFVAEASDKLMALSLPLWELSSFSEAAMGSLRCACRTAMPVSQTLSGGA